MTNLSLDNAGELRDFFFTIIESLPAGILLADGGGGLLALNQRARVMLGLSPVSFLGKSCWDILQQGVGVSSAAVASLQKSGDRVLCEVVGKQGGGSRTVAIVRNDLQSPFLHLSGFFLSLEDMTDLVMLEAQVERQKRFAAMQELAVNLSQELRNPLGSMELYTSLLRRDLDHDPDSCGVLARMTQAVRTMDHLLSNYVTLANHPRPSYAQVVVRDWLEDAAARLRVFAGEGGCEVRCCFGHAEETIPGDASMLLQLAMNLGLNGLEAMAGAGVLDIATREHPAVPGLSACLEISFADSGIGIVAAHTEKIFDPFFTTKDRASGLGLAIVHLVVEAHHGLVRVNSRKGGGTVFTVLLPRVAK
jgi:PAS domain S-box-containing protein